MSLLSKSIASLFNFKSKFQEGFILFNYFNTNLQNCIYLWVFEILEKISSIAACAIPFF